MRLTDLELGWRELELDEEIIEGDMQFCAHNLFSRDMSLIIGKTTNILRVTGGNVCGMCIFVRPAPKQEPIII